MYSNKGSATASLKLFIDQYCNNKSVLVDPDINNIAAINLYKKVDFKRIDSKVDNVVWMIKN